MRAHSEQNLRRFLSDFVDLEAVEVHPADDQSQGDCRAPGDPGPAVNQDGLARDHVSELKHALDVLFPGNPNQFVLFKTFPAHRIVADHFKNLPEPAVLNRRPLRLADRNHVPEIRITPRDTWQIALSADGEMALEDVDEHAF